MRKAPAAMTDVEAKALPPKPLAFLKDAERRARTAVSLFDVGIARGLLLGLLKEGSISEAQACAWRVIAPRPVQHPDWCCA